MYWMGRSMNVAFFAPSYPFSTQRPTLLFWTTKKMRTQNSYTTPSLIRGLAADGCAAMHRAISQGWSAESTSTLRRLHKCRVMND